MVFIEIASRPNAELLLSPNPNPQNFQIQEPYPAMEQNGSGHYGIQDVYTPEGQFSAPPQYQPATAGYPVQNYAPPPAPVYQYPYQESYQEPYVITQLTEPSKPNYPVQTFPIHEPAYNPPEFPRIFPDDVANKTDDDDNNKSGDADPATKE